MANENYKPDLNQKVPDGPAKTYPWLTTVRPTRPTGYVSLFPFDPGDFKKLQYAVETGGSGGSSGGKITWRVVDDQGNVRRQFNSIQEMKDSGYNFGFTLNEHNINVIKNKLGGYLKAEDRELKLGGIQPSPYFTGQIPGRPTAPAPASPTGQTSDAADAGPYSGISTTFDVSGASELTNELSNFGDNNNFNALTPFLFYPQNIAGTGQDRIIITQVEYVPAPIAQTNISVQTAATALGNRESQFTKPLGYVTLPIPNDLSETNGVGWGEDSLSSITAALMSNATQFAGGVASGDVQATLGSLENAVGKLNNPAISDRFKRFLTVNAGASILKLGGINVNPEAYISRVTGVAINPNLELLFNGPKLRQFAFTFKMTPRSEKEAKNIRSIIKFFKKGMSPRRTTTAEKSIYLGTPNVFQMKFVSGSGGEITSIGKMKTCALVSCGVNYTPDGFYAAYSDSKTGSQPIAVVLTLGFTELTPIFSDDYDVNVEGVGPEPNLNYNVAQPTPPPDTTPPVAGGGQGGRRGSGNSPGGIDPNSTNQLRGRAR